MKSIKVVRSGPAATSKSPSTSNQRPAKADALPVRDEVYNLPSDDDADMIECEPDPDDVKPTLSLGPAASVAASASSARNKSKPATPLKTKPAAVKRPTKASAVAKKVGKKAGKQLDGPQPPTVAKARIVKGRKPQPSVVLHFPSPTTSLSKTPAFEPIGPASNKVGDKPIPDAPASPTASEPLFARATPAPAPVVLPIAVSSSPVSIAQGPASGLLNPPAAAALPVLVSGHASVNPSGQDEAASVHSAIGQPTDDGIVRQLFKGKGAFGRPWHQATLSDSLLLSSSQSSRSSAIPCVEVLLLSCPPEHALLTSLLYFDSGRLLHLHNLRRLLQVSPRAFQSARCPLCR
jgi:hypothetical protein